MGTVVQNLGSLKKSTVQRNSRRAASWMKNKIKSADKESLKTIPRIGMMYFMIYDAKYKNELPYWDAVPLIIPISYTENGMIGLNLHYLAPRERLILLNKLMKLTVGKGEKARMKLSYELLTSAAKYKAFKPTIKRYLKSHVKSKFALVSEDEWEMAAALPVARFRGATKSQVYKYSRDEYK